MTQLTITPAVGTIPNNLLIGECAVLNCNTDLNTDIGPDMSSLHKEWYHNDEIITTGLAQRGDSLQLQLKKIKTSHAGYYECLAWIDGNTLRNKSDSILLYVNCECIYSSKCFKLTRHNYSSVITSHPIMDGGPPLFSLNRLTVGCNEYMIIHVQGS